MDPPLDKNGFTALETLLNGRNWQGPYCHGEQVTIADACLIPQIYNARRFEIVMDDFPTLVRIEQRAWNWTRSGERRRKTRSMQIPER